MSAEEIKETVGRKRGVDPAEVEVVYPGERVKSKAMRLAVAFSRWNSSLDPRAQRSDPSLN